VLDEFEKWLRISVDPFIDGQVKLIVRRKEDPLALHKCCAEGNHTLLRMLLSEGGWDLTHTDDNNMTAAHVACQKGHIQCLAAISNELSKSSDLSLGDVFRADRKLPHLLYVAAEYGQNEVVRFFLTDPSIRCTVGFDDSALSKTVLNLHHANDTAIEDIVGMLVHLRLCRLTPNVLRTLSSVPLHQRLALLKALIRTFPDEHSALCMPIEGSSPETMALCAPKCDLLDAMLASVELCFLKQDVECLTALLQNVRDDFAKPVLTRAVDALIRSVWEDEATAILFCKRVLEVASSRCSPLGEFLDSISALHAACGKLKPSFVKDMLDGGASPIKQGINGFAPAYLCLELISRDKVPSGTSATDLVIEVMELLLAAPGCTVDHMVSKAGATALMVASQNNDMPIVKYLLSKGASIKAVDAKNKSAVHYAAMMGSDGSLEQLLKAGAPADVLTKTGLSALEVSLEHLAQAKPVHAVERKAASAVTNKPKNPKKAAAAAATTTAEEKHEMTEVDKLADSLERPWANNVRQALQWIRSLDLLLEYGCPIRPERAPLVDRVLAKLVKSGADMTLCDRLKTWQAKHLTTNGKKVDDWSQQQQQARDEKELNDVPAEDAVVVDGKGLEKPAWDVAAVPQIEETTPAQEVTRDSTTDSGYLAQPPTTPQGIDAQQGDSSGTADSSPTRSGDEHEGAAEEEEGVVAEAEADADEGFQVVQSRRKKKETANGSAGESKERSPRGERRYRSQQRRYHRPPTNNNNTNTITTNNITPTNTNTSTTTNSTTNNNTNTTNSSNTIANPKSLSEPENDSVSPTTNHY